MPGNRPITGAQREARRASMRKLNALKRKRKMRWLAPELPALEPSRRWLAPKPRSPAEREALARAVARADVARKVARRIARRNRSEAGT
ncbi:hypothetical protein [Methylocella sp.]|uniref:hypothetical protein n=1 Tax=Methylocella sp. TaxID=1978226 RepID=UPI0035AF65EA